MEKDSSKHSRSSIELEKSGDPAGSFLSFEENEAAELEKTVWRKMDLRILPVVTVLYLLSWLDRTNFGNARVAGLQKDLGLTSKQYSMALTVTFIPYILSEIPSNLLLKIIGPNLLLPALLTSWGIVTTLQGVAKNYAGILACRFFIGLLEGGVIPGLVLYLSFFYPRRKLQLRISIFFSSASLAGAFSGLLAAAISNMDGVGGKPAWAWIFLLEGLMTIVIGVITFFVLPATHNNTTYLSKREKDYITSQLRLDGAISSNDKADGFSWKEVGKTFFLPHLWLLFVVYFCNGTIVYSLGYFTPTIVQGLGKYTNAVTQLLSVGPFAFAFVITNIVSFLADRYKCRGLAVIFSATLCVIGFIMFLVSHKTSVLYGSLFMTVGGVNCSSPALAAWVANNTSPHVRRATALAVLSMVTNSGGIFSTWLFGLLSTGPRFTKGMTVLLSFSAVWGVFAAFNLAYLYTANRKKAVQREKVSKEDEPQGLGDKSAYFEYIL